MNRTASTMLFDKFTDRARKVMSLARQAAQRLNSEFIGTEHILLGIMDEGGNNAVKFLKDVGVTSQAVRREIEKIITPSTSPMVTLGQLPFAPRAKRVLELAGLSAGSEPVDNGNLLLGLIREKDGIAAQVLTTLGVKEDDFIGYKTSKWTYAKNAKEIDQWLSNVKSAKVDSLRLSHDINVEPASLSVGEIKKYLKQSTGAFLSADGGTLFVKIQHPFGLIMVELKK